MTTTEQIAAAVEAMDRAEWTSAIALLIGLLPVDEPQVESTVRMLLAQALHTTGEEERARKQARQALTVAERTDDRGLIWKCMALLASMEIIDEGRL